VWFFSAARFVKNENYVGGVLANLNAGDPTKWLYQADPDTRGVLVEDCAVCCRPWAITVERDGDKLRVHVSRAQ